MKSFAWSLGTFILMLVVAYFLPGDPRANVTGVVFGTLFFGLLTFVLGFAVKISLGITMLYISVFAGMMLFSPGSGVRTVALTLFVWIFKLYIQRNFQKIAKGVSYKIKL